MSALENILGMLPDRMYPAKTKDSQIFTPPKIAKEMIEALPKEVWNSQTTFLDICCKSGIFLYEIYQKLMQTDTLVKDFPEVNDRREHIVNKQLFGIAPDDMCQMFSTRVAYGYIPTKSNIISFGNNYTNIMTNIDKKFLIDRLKKEFETMKFDVVIGNPPYNKGMDLDFVDLGYKLSNKYTCMISPAKWQTADADQKIASKLSYGQFRELYVPHMSYVCFYPDCKDIFDIYQCDGISYYILDKGKTDKLLWSSFFVTLLANIFMDCCLKIYLWYIPVSRVFRTASGGKPLTQGCTTGHG